MGVKQAQCRRELRKVKELLSLNLGVVAVEQSH